MIRWPYSWRKKEGCPLPIPHLAGLLYWRDCKLENLFIHTARLPKYGLNDQPRKEKVVVSLTTFPARIDACYYAIKSLMIQSFKADRIVLWLAESQFPDHKTGKKMQKLIERGLEIRYCPEDLRSHKKYFYMLQEQKPDELVVTFDDDIIYDYRALERLYKLHQKYPDCVACQRGHYVLIKNDALASYYDWKICSPEGVAQPSQFIMPSTGGGCLYPYHVMPESTFDVELIKKYAFTADDIWMFFNRLRTNTYAIKVAEKIPILCTVNKSQKEALTVINDIGGQNQKVIDLLVTVFPDALKKLIDN